MYEGVHERACTVVGVGLCAYMWVYGYTCDVLVECV